MMYVVDGSNLLGRARVDREGEVEKRRLLQRLASFARQKRAKLTLFFDGSAPANFATSLGSVSVRFSGKEAADPLIVATVANLRGRVHLVTSDRALATRCARRDVIVVDPASLLGELDRPDESKPDVTDWEQYFSDPKNKSDF